MFAPCKTTQAWIFLSWKGSEGWAVAFVWAMWLNCGQSSVWTPPGPLCLQGPEVAKPRPASAAAWPLPQGPHSSLGVSGMSSGTACFCSSQFLLPAVGAFPFLFGFFRCELDADLRFSSLSNVSVSGSCFRCAHAWPRPRSAARRTFVLVQVQRLSDLRLSSSLDRVC